jgi:UDP-N-acetylglucosamine/UDP-N-acetylgalactosamine diphosphorylase
MNAQRLEQLASHQQQHLLAFWDDLSPGEQQVLAAEIDALDLDQIDRLLHDRAADEDWTELSRRAEPPEAIRLTGQRPFPADAARARGDAALAAGQVGVVLVAGGQGTRLGFDRPKGMFPIGPVSNATLFQVLFQKTLATARRYATAIPLCVMTSPATHDDTVAFLAQHDQFGMPADDVHIFCQGTLPAINASTGRLLLAERGRLALSPDGHGGLLAALRRAGLIEHLAQRGIRHLFYMQVDNPLVRVCDPEFIGYHLLCESEVSTQVVAKHDPLDRVGNLARIDGRTRMIEYSDLPDEVARRRADDGSLLLWAGNTAIHVFDLDFLARMAAAPEGLPLHRAHKKVPYIDESGRLVEPATPNALKFERFIFDLLPAARRAIAVEVDPAIIFAPVKNASGAAKDTPETCRAAWSLLHASWLRASGAEVTPGVPIEICPLFALDQADLAARGVAGLRVSEATYLTE